MEKQCKRRFSFEVDKKLAKANDFRLRKAKREGIILLFVAIFALICMILAFFKPGKESYIGLSIIATSAIITIISVIKGMKDLHSNQYILNNGDLIPGIITEVDKKHIGVLALISFTEQSLWATYSISLKVKNTNSQIGDKIPLMYTSIGKSSKNMFTQIYFAPIYWGTNTPETIETASNKIDEFEWNFLERNTKRYKYIPILPENKSIEFLTGEDIHRYSLDKI